MTLADYKTAITNLETVAARLGLSIDVAVCPRKRVYTKRRASQSPQARAMTAAVRAKLRRAQKRIWREKRATAARNILNRVREKAHAQGR